MRHREEPRPHRARSVEEEIQVQRAWFVPLGAHASLVVLDARQGMQELEG
jgi:hypothetical protein